MTRIDRLVVLALALVLTGCGDSALPSASAAVYGGSPVSRDSLTPSDLAYGQVVYVPVYSEFGFGKGKGKKRYAFAVNVSIRNTDPKQSITITSARYYDNDGKFLREYLQDARALGPLDTTTVIVSQKDMTGGLGANVIVEWGSGNAVSAPVIEAVMFGRRGTEGAAAFRSPGRVIEERRP
ncbi:MAG: DUF3124 domain-containing protein [Planctomycetota bacterium]|nr:DUF3124 domain-containing protein [Planctomycetota bacterium]